MNNFDQAMRSAVDRLYAITGVDAIFTDRAAVQTPCRIVIEHTLTQYGDAAQFNAGTVSINVRASELAGAPRSAEKFSVGENNYIVDRLQSSDGIEHKVFAA